MGLACAIKKKAAWCKQQLYILYLAYRDPRTPRHAKALAALVIAYALSPIDLIPDFIPVLGYLDDVILLPLGIMLAIKLIPRQVWTDSRIMARRLADPGRPPSRSGANPVIAVTVIVAIWLMVLVAGGALLITFF